MLVILIYFIAGLVLGYLLCLVTTHKPRTKTAYVTADTMLTLGDGTRYRVGDIPRDPTTGRVDPAWLDEHCKCGKKHA